MKDGTNTDDGHISVYQNNSEVIRIDGSLGNISASGGITASVGMFTGLPQSGSQPMSPGELYYATGQQLGLSGSHPLSQSRIEAAKFVLVAFEYQVVHMTAPSLEFAKAGSGIGKDFYGITHQVGVE